MVSIIILISFSVFSNIDVTSENEVTHFEETGSFIGDIGKIFLNNLKAIVIYIIPVLGFGKFLLDILITAVSIKVFLYHSSFWELAKLFLPHFLFEFYAMIIWVFLSWMLFKDFLLKSNEKTSGKNYVLLISFSILLLLLAAFIEIVERRIFID